MKKNIALRIDDFGASSKEFEIYTKKFGRFGNYIGLHHFKKYRAWAKYQELETHELKTFINLLSNANCKATLGITASWQLKDGTLVSYPDKFPDNVALIKEVIDADLIEIANHGLTHCVTENFSFTKVFFIKSILSSGILGLEKSICNKDKCETESIDTLRYLWN